MCFTVLTERLILLSGECGILQQQSLVIAGALFVFLGVTVVTFRREIVRGL